MVTGTRIPPYAGMAWLAGNLTRSDYGTKSIAAGGCLVMFWLDREVTLPQVGPTQVAGYFADRSACRP